MMRTARVSIKKTPKNRTKRKSNANIKTKDYVVAIPSYNRSDVLAKKTLATLHSGSVPVSKIHIFVANQEEYDKYQTAIPKHLYGKMVIGKLGISNQRRFIVEYFPEGQKVVSLDDDVEKILKKVKESDTKLQQIRNVDAFFKEAFDRAQKEGCFIWGVYPTANPFFLRGGVTTTLKFIIGGLYGFIVRHDKGLMPSPESEGKEDVELTILHYICDKKILRYNYICFKSKNFSSGGLGIQKDRIKSSEKAAKYLERKYKQYASMWRRPNGMYEVRLRDKTDKSKEAEE